MTVCTLVRRGAYQMYKRYNGFITLPQYNACVGNRLRERSAHTSQQASRGLLSESIPSVLVYRGAVGASLRGPKLWALAPSISLLPAGSPAGGASAPYLRFPSGIPRGR